MTHSRSRSWRSFFFFFNDTAPPEISTLPLHDALPISGDSRQPCDPLAHPLVETVDVGRLVAERAKVPAGYDQLIRVEAQPQALYMPQAGEEQPGMYRRSEEHTSELQSRLHLVCRLLLE